MTKGQKCPGQKCPGLPSHTAHPRHTLSPSFFPLSLVLPFLLLVSDCLQGSSTTSASLTSFFPSRSLVPAHLHSVRALQVPQSFRFSHSTRTSAPATNKQEKSPRITFFHLGRTFRGKPCLPFQAAPFPQHRVQPCKGNLPSPPLHYPINSCKEMIKTGLTQQPDKRGCRRNLLPPEEQPRLPQRCPEERNSPSPQLPWHT